MAAVPALPGRSISVADWSAPDRRLWEAAQASGRSNGLLRRTIQKIAQNYGFWLVFALSQGYPACFERPSERISNERIEAYVEFLRRQGRSVRAIEMRLYGLRRALKLMEPDWDNRRIVFRRDPALRPPALKVSPVESWPDEDRRLWQAGLEPGDIFDERADAPILRPATLAKYAAGYSQWLVFLRSRDLLDASASPAARVSRTNVQAYFNASRAAGHARATTIMRLTDLRAALRIMQPEIDFRWLTTPGGRSLASRLPAGRRSLLVIDSDVLYAWGIALILEALDNPNPSRRRTGLRNGLLIALFAARAPRCRSMGSLRIGTGITRNGDTYRLVFEEADMKTGQPLDYDAPPGLSLAITRYLEVERRELLGGADHDWLWVKEDGQRLADSGIQGVIRRLSKQRFGKSFGPHRFRHALGTCAPLKDPEHPSLAAAILDITGRVAQASYNRADKAKASRRFHAGLREDRKATRSLARRAFSKRRRDKSKANEGGEGQVST